MYNSNIPSRAELPSSKQLVRSTVLAFIAACILLVTVVLPSEYGIDPTGIGGTLGLTKMGQIKVALAEEAKADALQDTSMASMQTAPVAPQAPAPQAPPQSVSQTVASWGQHGHSHDAEAHAAVLESASQTVAPQVSASQITPKKQHTMTITLRPGQGAEIKMIMSENAAADYEWISDGPVNVDVHGEPTPPAKGSSHSYSKERQIQKSIGTLVAAFDGSHGWFWRNRTNRDVTLQLTTTGEYQEIKRVI